jgi:putative aldouronate transport system permease protein
MLLPGLVWLIMFSIIPMFGVLIAFQDYQPVNGVFGSDWVGLENFRYMFDLTDSRIIFWNTIRIAIMKIAANLIVPVIFALMLHEVQKAVFKKWVQTIVYLPHFLSWVILSGIIINILSFSGPVNHLLTVLHLEPVLFMGKPDLFPYLAVSSDVWKEFGFNTIVYLAALTGINPSLYEAAALDGANRWQRLTNITLPSITPTVMLLLILSLGNVLNAGFDQIFNLYNPLVYQTADIIDTWVYREGLLKMQYGLATAVGLLKSAVGFILITCSYYLANRFTNYRIF